MHLAPSNLQSDVSQRVNSSKLWLEGWIAGTGSSEESLKTQACR